MGSRPGGIGKFIGKHGSRRDEVSGSTSKKLPPANLVMWGSICQNSYMARQRRSAPSPGDRARPAAPVEFTTGHLKQIGDTWTNSIGMKFTCVPAGEFDMGSPPTEVGRWDNETLHHVKITRTFAMATAPFTPSSVRILASARLRMGARRDVGRVRPF